MSRKSRSTSFLHIYGVNLRVYHLNGFQKLLNNEIVVSLCLSLPTIVSLGSVIPCDRESCSRDDHQSYYNSGWGGGQTAGQGFRKEENLVTV